MASPAIHERKSGRLLGHPVRVRRQRLRDGDPERLCGPQVDDELDACRQLGRQVSCACALQDAIHIDSQATIIVVQMEVVRGDEPVLCECAQPETAGSRFFSANSAILAARATIRCPLAGISDRLQWSVIRLDPGRALPR
jgi:hypothetical protein